MEFKTLSSKGWIMFKKKSKFYTENKKTPAVMLWIYTYLYTYTYVYIYVYIYIHIQLNDIT